ncbi:unnamed protein product [Mytilus coruscus]|uniref:DUF5641 domain-containing protein n=1 Tax=Mytilus coruscus TaxID=42192 RepID=A0A6J8AWQ5_MYTCO|nr:unnamed protein product [Mytilus coruscus]
MHVFKIGSQDGIKSKPEASASNYGEEKSSKEEVVTKCTEVCKGGVGKSCAKIVLLDILHVQKPNTRMRIYAIIDEQSNSSLVHGDILDYFDIKAESRQYSLSSCSGKVMMNGRRASGFVVQSLDGQNLELPTLIECDMIPNNRNEIPTCDVAANYQHLASIAQFIPPLDAEAKILLLIGRDLMQAHHVLDQKIGKPYQPYAQRLKLGWIIVGESCLDDHIDEVPSSFPLVTPDEDCEVRILKTTVGKEVPFGIHRFEHFSTWISLVRAVTTLKTKLRTICFGQDKNRRQVTQDFSSKDLFKKQWKGIQHLANQFWHRWKSEFLPSLQSRKKWQQDRKNVQEGDIVLMCDKSLHRNEWPVGIIIKTHTSDDNRVRKVDVRLGKDRKTFTRPVNELIVLLPN